MWNSTFVWVSARSRASDTKTMLLKTETLWKLNKWKGHLAFKSIGCKWTKPILLEIICPLALSANISKAFSLYLWFLFIFPLGLLLIKLSIILLLSPTQLQFFLDCYKNVIWYELFPLVSCSLHLRTPLFKPSDVQPSATTATELHDPWAFCKFLSSHQQNQLGGLCCCPTRLASSNHQNGVVSEHCQP